MCVCVCVCECECTHIRTYVHAHTYVHTCTHVRTYVHVCKQSFTSHVYIGPLVIRTMHLCVSLLHIAVDVFCMYILLDCTHSSLSSYCMYQCTYVHTHVLMYVLWNLVETNFRGLKIFCFYYHEFFLSGDSAHMHTTTANQTCLRVCIRICTY